MILVLVPVIFELCFVGVLAILLSNAEKEFDGLQHSKNVILAMHHTEELSLRAFGAIASDGRGPLDEKLAEVRNLERELSKGSYVDAVTILPELKGLLEQDKAVRGNLLKLIGEMNSEFGDPSVPMKERRFKYLQYRHKSKAAFAQVLFDTAPYSKQVLEVERRVRSAEPEEMRQTQNMLWIVVIAFLIVSVFISLFLAKLFMQDIIIRLRQVSNNARLIAAWKTLPARQEGHDEIAEFDRVLHLASTTLNYAHEKQATILDNAASIICSLDSRLKFVDVNATATRYWQYQPDELLGLSLLTLLRRDTVNDTKANLERISEGAHQGEVENLVRCKSKTFMNCLWTVNWLPLKQRFYCVVHDVTELRAVERLKQYVLSIVGHDLRAPLTAVSLNLGLILDVKRDEVSEAALKEFQKAEKSLTRLMQLVNDLLELEKFGVGKTKLDRSCVSAADIFSDAKEAVDALASQAAVTIKGPVGDYAIYGDSQRLIQVAINLLANAIKFSPPGSSIDLAIEKKNNSLIELRVTDRGPGIPHEDVPLIFDKFHQVRSTADLANVNMKSTGLGLAIVKEIVSAHSGECGVESEFGKGSTFWFRIPEFIDPLEDDI